MYGLGAYGGSGVAEGNFTALLCNYIGETVTIFTSSGGQSGSGFTGVVLSVNNVFVRLITRIGPPPGCSLGNACTDFNVGTGSYDGYCGGKRGGWAEGAGMSAGWNGNPVTNVGSITDIPVASIVSFVHNAV